MTDPLLLSDAKRRAEPRFLICKARRIRHPAVCDDVTAPSMPDVGGRSSRLARLAGAETAPFVVGLWMEGRCGLDPSLTTGRDWEAEDVRHLHWRHHSTLQLHALESEFFVVLGGDIRNHYGAAE
jgi:hypothetical protein